MEYCENCGKELEERMTIDGVEMFCATCELVEDETAILVNMGIVGEAY